MDLDDLRHYTHMNNNTMVIGGVMALVLVGGLVVYGMSGKNTPSGTATSTPTNTTTNTNPTPTVNSSTPTVTTNTLVIASNSTAVVTGRVIPNGAQTSYWYEYGRTNALGTRTNTQAVGSGYASIATPGVINGLTANTVYYYRLGAQNAHGAVVGQVYSFTTTNINPPVQGIGPTTRTDAASAITRTSVNVHGQITPNSSETLYWFEWGETNELGNTTAFQSAGNGTVTKAVSVSLSALKPLTKYYFRLNAQNQFGTMTGGTMSFTTAGPAASGTPAITTIGASSVATSSVTMRGRLNPNGAQTTYWFEYSTNPLLTTVLRSTPRVALPGSGTVAVSVSANVTGLTANTKYYYRFVANNTHGNVQGGIVSFTTQKK